ncbi:Transcription factor 25 [Saguinus oedipus]|uniref:Transcription factor 25 n=1 Tax=Saguinus oedipus TaxID=9490 RepID=A0ABQ9THG3_SAGOE|nr:Transcription factor 25 [Saguinus oedipus]
MSCRALRRLRGEQRGQEPLEPGALKFDLRDDDDAKEGPKRELGGRCPGKAGKEGVRVNNRFELINIEDLEDDTVVNGERHLNPDTELKRYFGARAVLGEERPRQRQRVYPKCTWPRYSKPGLSMRLLEYKKGLPLFAFEHGEKYQQAQRNFLVAVESMEPNNIVVLLQRSPYHVDSLLQLSDACRFEEDQEMARDLIETALYSMECAFHPLFSLTSGACRLGYRRPENRSFYLALYKQMSFLEKRGCPRTTLEYCKLILSLEPDEDPLCMLLLIDHLALRARNYEYLIRLFQEWEAHRNLSQLPNFAFSLPLAYFLLSQQTALCPEPAGEPVSREVTLSLERARQRELARGERPQGAAGSGRWRPCSGSL